MNSFNFWRKWLLMASIILIAFGLGLAFSNQSTFFNLILNDQINLAFLGSTQIDGTLAHFQGWIYGVLGATVAVWGVMVLFLIQYPFKNHEKWAWSAAAFSIGLWSWLILPYRWPMGCFSMRPFNTLVLVLFALPLIFTRKYFTGT